MKQPCALPITIQRRREMQTIQALVEIEFYPVCLFVQAIYPRLEQQPAGDQTVQLPYTFSLYHHPPYKRDGDINE